MDREEALEREDTLFFILIGIVFEMGLLVLLMYVEKIPQITRIKVTEVEISEVLEKKVEKMKEQAKKIEEEKKIAEEKKIPPQQSIKERLEQIKEEKKLERLELERKEIPRPREELLERPKIGEMTSPEVDKAEPERPAGDRNLRPAMESSHPDMGPARPSVETTKIAMVPEMQSSRQDLRPGLGRGGGGGSGPGISGGSLPKGPATSRPSLGIKLEEGAQGQGVIVIPGAVSGKGGGGGGRVSNKPQLVTLSPGGGTGEGTGGTGSGEGKKAEVSSRPRVSVVPEPTPSLKEEEEEKKETKIKLPERGGTSTARQQSANIEITGLGGRQVIRQESPVYPDEALRNGWCGKVKVKFIVLPNGRVGKTVLEITSGYDCLDNVAIEAIKKWRFASLPLEVEQQEMNGWATIIFRL